MLRQVLQCKQKKWRWHSWDSPLANLRNQNARCSLASKNIKQCWNKEMLFKNNLLSNDYTRPLQVHKFRELLPNTTYIFQGNCNRQYFFLSQLWTYSKSLLTGISEKSTFRTEKSLKKLKLIFCWDIYCFCYD